MEQLNINVSSKKIIMQDIYHKINFKLVDNNFDFLNLEAKKDLIMQELKNYMISKILELDSKVKISKDADIYILVDILGCV